MAELGYYVTACQHHLWSTALIICQHGPLTTSGVGQLGKAFMGRPAFGPELEYIEQGDGNA